MKRFTRILLGACVLPLTAFAGGSANAAASDWYWGLSGDATWAPHSNTGGGGNIALGARLWPSNFGAWRLEAEFGYHAVPNETGYNGNTHYYTYMGNLYYDFASWRAMSGANGNGGLVPYIGAGIGDATVSFGERRTFSTFHNNDNVFAYQFMAGVSYVSPTMPDIDWSLGYRYVGSNDSDITVGAVSRSDRLSSNNIELGVRFHF